MTTPNERTRALRWGAELLLELVHHAGTSEIDREVATGLLANYPDPQRVQQWIEDEVKTIPTEAAQAIEQAGTMFRSIQFAARCPPELSNSLRFTLRHFPEHGHALQWSDPRGRESIRWWLLPEDHYG